jgi:hypothetical protein
MDIQNNSVQILIFYDERDSDGKYDRSVEHLSECYTTTIITNFNELIKRDPNAKKQFTYRYMSKDSLVRLADEIKQKCDRDSKFIIFGEINREMKESI